MSDLKVKLTDFFHSDYNKFDDFKQSLVESKNAIDWANAVNMFRQGMKKLKENDLSGCEDIKKSNEMLKAVVSTSKKEEAVKAEVQGLNEAIEKIDVKKASESIDTLGTCLSALYEAMKTAGMPAMLNESELYDETCPMCGDDVQPEETTVVNVKEMAPAMAGAAPTATVPPTAPSTPPAGAAPVATTPTSSAPAGAAPTATSTPTESVKESAYEHGFMEARKRYLKGGNAKQAAKDIAEKELSERAYSYVNRYMEGFVAGHAFHEEVMRDTDPKLYEEAK